MNRRSGRVSRVVTAVSIAVLVALFVGLAWLRRAASRPRAHAQLEAVALQRQPSPAAPRAEDVVAARARLESEASAQATSPPPEAPTDPRRGLLQGTVVDRAHAPIAGARVALVHAAALDNTLLWETEPDFRAGLESAGETRSDAHGRFSFVLARGVPVDLEMSAEGNGEAFLSGHYADEDLLVELGGEGVVHGRLTRERDGAPIEAALVRVLEYGSLATRETHSDADGSYRLAFPFRDFVYLEVLPRSEEALSWQPITLAADRTAQMDFVLEDGVAVMGRVTEAGNARPIAGAIVGEGWQFRRTAVSDADGRYRLAGIGGAGAYGLSAKAHGHGLVKRMQLPAVVDGAITVDFELPLAWSARGRCVDRSGRALADVQLAACSFASDANGQSNSRSAGRTDADGRWQLEDLVPGRAHTLTATKLGYASLSTKIEPVDGARVLDFGELVLAPPALVAGRVLDAQGQPAVAVEVTLAGEHASESARSDAQGRFAFNSIGAGQFTLTGSRNGHKTPALELVLAEAELRQGLELRLPPGHVIRGSIVDERGAGVGGVNVFAELREPLVAGETLDQAMFTQSGEDGAFVVEDLPAGNYTLLVFARQPTRSDPDAPWLDGTHAVVATDSAPERLVLLQGTTIRGVVLDAAGLPLFNHCVVGTGPDGQRTWIAPTDAAGRFELVVERGTTWDLAVSGPLQSGNEHVLLSEHGILAGAQGVVLRLSSH